MTGRDSVAFPEHLLIVVVYAMVRSRHAKQTLWSLTEPETQVRLLLSVSSSCGKLKIRVGHVCFMQTRGWVSLG